MTGDVTDFVERLKSVLPSWFGDEFLLLMAFLNGFATLDAFIYSIYTYVQNQMRIQTATDSNLDLVACDFFGNFVQRLQNMTDTLFRKYILATLLQEEATRKGMSDAIFNFTGYYPAIFEPFGGEGQAFYNQDFYYNADSYYGGGGAPYNFWITVYVKYIENNFGGYNTTDYAYNTEMGNFYYGGDNEYIIQYDEILAIINRVKVGGTVPHLTLVYVT